MKRLSLFLIAFIGVMLLFSSKAFSQGGNVIDIPGEEVGDFGQIIGYVEEVRTVLINESHDGLIPSSSALIRTTGSTYHEFTVSGANHLEMKNHAGIKVCIEDEIDRYMSAQTIIGPVFPIL